MNRSQITRKKFMKLTNHMMTNAHWSWLGFNEEAKSIMGTAWVHNRTTRADGFKEYLIFNPAVNDDRAGYKDALRWFDIMIEERWNLSILLCINKEEDPEKASIGDFKTSFYFECIYWVDAVTGCIYAQPIKRVEVE